MIIMKNLLATFLILFSTYGFADEVKLKDLNGFYSSGAIKSKSIVMILHGTRGHQNLEIITSLRDSLLENNIDSLTINLSYGIQNRDNDFLPCDIEHTHKQSESQKEIKLWYEYVKKMEYEKIYLIGHSRGGLDMINFYERLDKNNKTSISSIFLLAPISDGWEDTIMDYKEKYNINLIHLKNEPTKKLSINFLGCENATVYSDSFLDYYYIFVDAHGFQAHEDIYDRALTLHLVNTLSKVHIITASEDTIAPDTYERVNDVIKFRKNIELHIIDGADHFFRDIYFDDLMDIVLEVITE